MEVTEKETTLNESHRLEIEITAVLLGFVFVMYSIILTMPNDVVTIVNQGGMTNFFGVPFVSYGDIISEFGLCSSFSLLGAILFYIWFLKTKKETMLLTARSFLASGLFLSVFLLVAINTLIGARLVGSKVNVYMNPFASLLLSFSTIATFGSILSLWVPWLYKNVRVRLKKARPLIHEVVMMTEKEQPKNEPDDILDLVEWIDGKQTEKHTPLFQMRDSLGGKMTGLVISLLVLFFVMWIIAYEYGISLVLKGQSGFDVAIVASSALLPALAVVIAGLSMFTPYLERNEVEVRYRRALKLRKKEVESSGKESKLSDFTEDQKPFLKALIEIRGKNEGFTLRQLHDLDKTNVVFSKEKLLERLCE